MQKNKQEKSPIKERILHYLELKSISKYAFYKESGVSRGVLDQETGISEENLARFLDYAQDISLNWLIAGEGEIFKTKTTENVPDENGDILGDILGDKQKLQKTSPNEPSVFAGIPDADIFEYLAEVTEKKIVEMVDSGRLVPLSVHEKMLKEKDEQILQERERIWNLQQQIRDKEKRAE